MGVLTDELILRLRKWCEKKEGRKKQVAEHLGIPPSALSNMFRAKKPQQPTGEQALAILNFLKAQQRRKAK